jgi:molybdopterin-guanine dinucleotide biosynthesis protein A
MKGGDGIVGVVLAGGISRRFGSEKALLRWRGRTFLELAVERLGRVADEVVVSVDRIERFRDGAPAPLVADIRPGGGAATGILSVLRRFEGRSVLVTPVDMPCLPVSTLRTLLASRDGSDAVVLKVLGRWQPLVGVYEASSAPVIARCLAEDERKIICILRRMKMRVIRSQERARRLLVNINTPDDYRRLTGGRGGPRDPTTVE